MCNDDIFDENSPSAAWTNAVNREGGLVKITPEAYQVFLAVINCVWCYLTVKKGIKNGQQF